MRPPVPLKNHAVYTTIGLASAGILGFLFWLIYFFKGLGEAPAWTEHLPLLTAIFNSTSACFIVAAVLAIHRKRVRLHAGFISVALFFSALFLAAYITNYAFYGDTKFPGTGWLRPLYFAILISHVLLSIAVVPLVLTTLLFAVTRHFTRHRRLARWTAPIWLYVSITGVVVFVLLHVSGPYG